MMPGQPYAITSEYPASATLNVIAVQPPSLSKAFAPNTIAAGGTSTLTITIRNNDSNNPLTQVTLTDTLPTNGDGDIFVASPVTTSLTGCGSGTLTDASGNPLVGGTSRSVRLNNGTIARNSNCVITVLVASNTQGVYTNTIPAGPATVNPGAILTREGVTNASAASAPLNVQAFNLTKSFGTSPVAVGQISLVTITIQNIATLDYTGVDLNDVLPAGLEYVSTPVATTCSSPSVSVAVTTTTNSNDTLSLTDGTIPAGTSCTITANARALMSTAAGTYTNTIPAGAMSTTQGATNHDPASASLDVVSLSIAKSFSPSTFAAGGNTVLTITISNPSPNAFTGTSVSDSLPTSPNSNLSFTGIPVTTCTTVGPPTESVTIGTTNYTNDTVRLTNGTIPGGSISSPGTCTITATVTTDADAPEAAYTGANANRIPAGAISTTEGGTNLTAATAPVTLETIRVSKAFNPDTVTYPNASRLTITITNPVTGGALTGISLTDTLPLGLEIAPPQPSPPAPANPATTCNFSTTPTLTAVTGTRDIILSNGSLPAATTAATSCTIVVYVRPTSSASSGSYRNTLGPGSVTTGEGPTNSNTSDADLTVNAVSVSKSFQYSGFQAGGNNILTITLRNWTGVAFTGVAVSDTLPTSPNSNLEFVPGSAASDCGVPPGTVFLTGGPPPRTVSLNGGTIPANSTCTITATVTTDPFAPADSYINTIPVGALTTAEGPSNTTAATAPVSVYADTTGVTGTKSFTPTSINLGQSSRLRLTFTAPPDTGLSSFSFTDTFPTAGNGDVEVASPLSVANSCGGSVTDGTGGMLATGDTSIRLTGGTIARGATCTVDVYVTSNAGSGPGILYTNTVNPGDVSSFENRTLIASLSAGLTVRTVSTLTISKAFYPDVVNPDGLSTLTITLQNTGAADLVNVSLDDLLPGGTSDGVVVAPVPNANTTCTGGTIDFPTSQTIRMTGGSIPRQVGGVPGICTINVDVQGKSTNGASPATHINTIPATNVIAAIQGTPSTMNAQGDASDNLVVRNITLEVVKGFNPLLVYGGANSQMSITLRNPNSAAELVGISFVDNMPPGEMILVDPPNFDASDCDPPTGPPAVLTGTAGGSIFSFSGGYLAPGDQCTLTFNATLTVNGNRTNTIPAGAVTSFNGGSNGTATSATLTNLAGASVSKSFAPNPIASGLSNYSILTITIRTTATVALTGMGLVDNLPAGIQVAGGSAPAPTNGCGGTLSAPPGATTIQLSDGVLGIGYETCSMTIPVAGANPGVYDNTIPAGTLTSDQNTTNNLPTTASLTLTPFSLGNRVWFDTDNNGTRGASEVSIPGVRVILYRDNGSTPGVFDSGDTLIGFDITDASGFYRFDDLGPDNYVVVIPADNFRNVGTGDTVPGDPLAGYWSSGTNISFNGNLADSIGPDPDNNVDDDDNGETTFSGSLVNYVSSNAVTLGPSPTEPTGEDNPTTNPETGEAVDNQSNRTVDFGFYRQQLGNQVFQDVNENGVFDSGDAPLAGARVQLFAANGATEINVGPDGILGTADDAPGGVTSTSAGTPGNPTGNYRFSGLPEGNYIVKVLPTGNPSTVDTANPADTSNPNTNADDNDNGPGTSGATVASNIVTLTPGSAGALSRNVVTNSTGTTYNPTVDFGYVTSFAKVLIGGEPNHTTDPEVTIGELVTYEVAMVIPAGGLSNVQLVDTPQNGLAFADCVTITIPAGVTSNFINGGCDTLDGSTPGSNPLVENSGGRVTFNFGNVGNTSGVSQTVRVRYTLIVLNILANQDGDTLTNTAAWTWTGGSRITSAPIVEIVEPELTIDKNATPTTVPVGGLVTFTIDLAHSTISSADAFDVIVTDRIPSALTYDPASLVVGGTATLPSSNFDTATNTLTLVWDVIRLGETATVTFVAEYIGPPPVVNVSSVEWTSLEIDPALPGPPPVPVQRSPYNPNATERWYDPSAPAGVNSYATSDSVTINAQGAVQADVLPDTGFAPGRVSVLSEQPAEFVYADFGELTLEIPALGVETRIVGVPLAGDSWDITWLGENAGWLNGTAFPTWKGNSVITSHVYLPNGQPGPFVDLSTLKFGDRVIVSAYGQDYIYEVRTVKTVKPDDTSRVIRHEELPWITLLTCKDYDPRTDTYRNRIAVRAVLVSVIEK